jgi:cytochrome c oxidase cbb3-type subunit 3
MAGNPEVDPHTGINTTGHSWDGIQELNTPLPKWWLYVMYATIVWAIGYWVVYPAWPTFSDYTKGVWGYSDRAAVNSAVAEDKKAQSKWVAAIGKAGLAEIEASPELLNFSRAAGRSAFLNNCAGCHGSGAQGAIGYPNLNDDNWLWGGSLEQIYQTIAYGVRNGNDQARGPAAMPAFQGQLTPAQISDVAEYVLSLGRKPHDAAGAERGKAVFNGDGGCTSCHGEDGKGNQELGSANLTSGIYQWGGKKAELVQSIAVGRGGVMPAWTGRLEPETVKALAVYVHSLGGGK